VRRKLPAAPGRPDAAQVRQWLGQLDVADWKARDVATAELSAVAGQIRGELEAALAANPPEERRTRLQTVLRNLDAQLAAPATDDEPAGLQSGPAVRTRLRAVRVLARVATPDAVDLLREIAADAPDTVVAVRARASLRNM